MHDDIPWKDAIIKVLKEKASSMHYAEIADEIVAQGLRESVGATPQQTVNNYLTADINDNGDGSVFIRTARGEYMLRDQQVQETTEAIEPPIVTTAPAEQPATTLCDTVISAFGMYWRRDYVCWGASTGIYGEKSIGTTRINFAGQLGVYILHDQRSVIYAGRAVESNIGARLFSHTRDRLSGRWDRFSWFGLLPVLDDASLGGLPNPLHLGIDTMIATLESLLIEALEPPQNRKRGDDLKGVEYLQVEDPELQRQKKKLLLLDAAANV